MLYSVCMYVIERWLLVLLYGRVLMMGWMMEQDRLQYEPSLSKYTPTVWRNSLLKITR